LSALRPWLRQLRAAHFEREVLASRSDYYFRPLVGMTPGRAFAIVCGMLRSRQENGRIIVPAWLLDEIDQAGFMLEPGNVDLPRMLTLAEADDEPLVSDQHVAGARGGTYSNVLTEANSTTVPVR
jgi:hypothetical protein